MNENKQYDIDKKANKMDKNQKYKPCPICGRTYLFVHKHCGIEFIPEKIIDHETLTLKYLVTCHLKNKTISGKTMMKKQIKHKYITTKLLTEEGKCISAVVRIRYINDESIRINHHIVCNHCIICPTKNEPIIPTKLKSKRPDDAYKEKIIREEMNKNKDVSSTELYKITGFSADIVRRLYMKIRRENSLKTFKY